MTVREIRCAQPHPDDPSRPCNAVLTRAVLGTVDLRLGDQIPPGCNEVYCSRCRTRYVACPRAA